MSDTTVVRCEVIVGCSGHVTDEGKCVEYITRGVNTHGRHNELTGFGVVLSI